jgi:putative oxidoreductase
MNISSNDSLELIRILCGIWLVPHLLGKIRNVKLAAPTFEKVGLRPGRVVVILTIVLELIAGVGLVFGIYEETAGVLLVVVMLGASYAVLCLSGANWRWHKHGPEYMIVWAIVCVLPVIE